MGGVYPRAHEDTGSGWVAVRVQVLGFRARAWVFKVGGLGPEMCFYSFSQMLRQAVLPLYFTAPFLVPGPHKL